MDGSGALCRLCTSGVILPEILRKLLFFRCLGIKMEIAAGAALPQSLASLKVQVLADIREVQLIIFAENSAQLRASQLSAGIMPQAFANIIGKVV